MSEGSVALRDQIEQLQDEILRLRESEARAWTERNIAYAKVKGWEATMFVEGLPLRSVEVDQWGPGEGGETTVPQMTPRKLTDLLDEIAELREYKRRKEWPQPPERVRR
jgi:hypothetical protein